MATLVQAPVVLVLNASHASRTLAAVAAGLAHHDASVRVGGVILNRVGSVAATDELHRELADVGLPVLGAVPSTADVAVPSRHLGLVPAAERDEADAAIDAAGAVLAEHVDLTAVLEFARTAPPLAAEPWSPEAVVSPVVGRPRIAVAGGRAFTFRYP